MAKGILLAAMDFSAAPEDEFHDWYDLEHVPERLRVPGFLNGDRWIGANDPKISVATYDLDAIGVLQSPGYQAIGGENLSPWSKRVTSRVERLMRFEGDQVLPGDQLPPDNAGGFLLNAMNVEAAAEAEFNEWYNTEHIPALAAVPGGTIERVETDADHGSPYEAHVRKSDGTELEVLVNKDFQVTAVNTMQHP